MMHRQQSTDWQIFKYHSGCEVRDIKNNSQYESECASFWKQVFWKSTFHVVAWQGQLHEIFSTLTFTSADFLEPFTTIFDDSRTSNLACTGSWLELQITPPIFVFSVPSIIRKSTTFLRNAVRVWKSALKQEKRENISNIIRTIRTVITGRLQNQYWPPFQTW